MDCSATDEEQTLAGGLSIRQSRIADLKAFPSNARTHSKSQLKKIAESIRAFGFTNPVLVDRSHTIIAGHGRVEAAKLLKMQVVPTICLEMLSSAQVRAYVLADNRLAEDAGWDKEILKIELQHLVLDTEIDISVTGFEIAEVDLLLANEVAQDDQADLLPTGSAEAVTRAGDLWVLGDHRVFCGDSRDQSSFHKLMKGRKADLVFTDPPYNVVIDGNVSGKGRVKHGDFAMGCGEMSRIEFIDFLEKCLGLLAQNSTSSAVQFVCMDWRHIAELLTAGEKVYHSLLNVCVWAKDNAGQGSFYRSQHELVFIFRTGKGKPRNNIQLGKFGRYRTNVWRYPAVRQHQTDEGNLLALHPTVKPVALVADAILDCSARGDLVLDGFLGSGSTLIAAERTGRICCGTELSPHYVDVAVQRWQKYTGEDARSSESGKTFNQMAEER